MAARCGCLSAVKTEDETIPNPRNRLQSALLLAAMAPVLFFPVILTAGQGVSCASLIVIDGDTIKCDGQNMRLLGGGVPFKSGVDAPEMGSRAKCEFERDLALKAKARLKELLLAGVPRIEDSGGETGHRAAGRW